MFRYKTPFLKKGSNYNNECSLKCLLTPKSPKGDFFKLLIFSSSPLGVRGKNGKNQQFEGFLYCTQ
ncbi:hypothetical protein [Anaerophaga thermohalophila]|uniref:hypothetical protein n=1 Tax=Anaerophaga thermohalophila TaxID=177400 RepID=UPI00315CEAB3